MEHPASTGHRLRVDVVALRTRYQVLLTMLYCSVHRKLLGMRLHAESVL